MSREEHEHEDSGHAFYFSRCAASKVEELVDNNELNRWRKKEIEQYRWLLVAFS